MHKMINKFQVAFKYLVLASIALIASSSQAASPKEDFSAQLDLSVFDQKILAEPRKDIHDGL